MFAIQYISLVLEQLLGENYNDKSLTVLKPHHISAASFQTPSASEVSLTSHKLKVAKLSKQPDKSLILPSKKVNAKESTDKSYLEASVTAEVQDNQLKVADTTEVLGENFEKEEVAEEQTLQIPTVAQLLDEVNKAAQETPESPYDTESEIKVVKSFFTSHLSELQDQTMNDYEESGIQEDFDSDLQSMPDDDLRSVFGFEGADSDDTHDKEVSHSAHTLQNDIASAERLSLPDHLDHICKEVNSLYSRLGNMESSIDMQTQLPNIKDLLESAVIIDETTEGEKKQKDKNAIPAPTQGEHQTAENITPPEPSPETQGDLAYNKSTLPVSKTKVNEESAIVLYNPEKDLVDLTTTEQDLKDDDDLDKQPLDKSKGKGIANEEPPKDIMSFIEEGGSVPKIPNLKSFILLEGTLSQEKFMAQLKEMKRLADLKEQEKKSEEELKKLLNLANLKAQDLKWEEHEEKKAKMLKEFNKCISERTNPLPITKISYDVNSSKTATMRITSDKDPLNLKVYPASDLECWASVNGWKFMLWHQRSQANHMMCYYKEKKRKRTEFLKEMFVNEDVRVYRMNRNLIPPLGVVLIEGLVIKEPESGIFFMNRNTDLAF
ncbi:hypothetical protein Tco_0073119 [Tanacetum coccineum]